MPFGKPIALYDQTVIRRPVAAVDHAWVARTAPGGQIRAPFYTLYHPAVLLTLTVQHNGVASGRFSPLPITALPWEPGCPCGLGPAADAAFFAGLALPGVRRLILHHGAPATHALWLEGPEDSWAEVTRPDGVAPRVQQGGVRRLWDEVMETWRRWEQLGQPRAEDLGFTVTPSAQWAWAWSPTTPLTMSR